MEPHSSSELDPRIVRYCEGVVTRLLAHPEWNDTMENTRKTILQLVQISLRPGAQRSPSSVVQKMRARLMQILEGNIGVDAAIEAHMQTINVRPRDHTQKF